jgi:hypothetical protein
MLPVGLSTTNLLRKNSRKAQGHGQAQGGEQDRFTYDFLQNNN